MRGLIRTLKIVGEERGKGAPRDAYNVSADTPENRGEQESRTQTGRFAKGKSGNPRGRPKLAGKIRELAQKHGEDAIGILWRIASNEEEDSKARIQACKELLDRGIGKPPQSTDLHVSGGLDHHEIDPKSFTPKQRQELIERFLARKKGEE